MIAPSFIVASVSAINFFSSKYWITPKPSHLLHAPKGLLKENILGSNSETEYPHCEQEKFDENNKRLSFSSRTSISTKPSERPNAVSIDSDSRDLLSSSCFN